MSDTDSTSPWFEFISFCRSCESLGVPVRLSAFMRYNSYLKSIGVL